MNKLKINSGHIYIDETELATVMLCEIQRSVYTTKLTLKLDVKKQKNDFPKLKISDINDEISIKLDDCKLENVIDYKLIGDNKATLELTLTMYINEVQVEI